MPASSLLDLQDGAQVMHCIAGTLKASVFVATTGGYGFFTKLGDMVSNRRAGRDFMSMPESEVPITPQFFNHETDHLVAVVSEKGKLLIFSAEEIKFLSKGRGVIVMGLDDDDKLSATGLLNKRTAKIIGQSPRAQKVDTILITGDKFEHHYLRRARMGRVLPRKLIGPHSISGG